MSQRLYDGDHPDVAGGLNHLANDLRDARGAWAGAGTG